MRVVKYLGVVVGAVVIVWAVAEASLAGIVRRYISLCYRGVIERHDGAFIDFFRSSVALMAVVAICFFASITLGWFACRKK